MGRGGRGRSRQRLRNARERAHRWWDRDAHWAEMGYTPEDAATKRRVVAWCWVVFVALTALMCAASRTFEPPPAPLSFSAKSEADCQDGAFLRHRRLASRRPGPSRPQACRDDAGAAPR